jgi:hypothetical protein
VTNLGNVRAIQRETVPFGWQVTKANHLLAASLDLNCLPRVRHEGDQQGRPRALQQ